MVSCSRASGLSTCPPRARMHTRLLTRGNSTRTRTRGNKCVCTHQDQSYVHACCVCVCVCVCVFIFFLCTCVCDMYVIFFGRPDFGAHFDSFPSAVYTLMRVLTGSWADLYDATQVCLLLWFAKKKHFWCSLSLSTIVVCELLSYLCSPHHMCLAWYTLATCAEQEILLCICL